MLYEITYKTNIYKDEKMKVILVKNAIMKETVELNEYNVGQILNNKGIPYKKKCRIFNNDIGLVIDHPYEEIKKAKFSNRIIIKGFIR